MRIPALVGLTIVTVLAAGPVRAQTYDPNFPVCLHVVKLGGGYQNCSFTTLDQCRMSSNGQSCDINPFYVGAAASPGRHGRPHRQLGRRLSGLTYRLALASTTESRRIALMARPQKPAAVQQAGTAQPPEQT